MYKMPETSNAILKFSSFIFPANTTICTVNVQLTNPFNACLHRCKYTRVSKILVFALKHMNMNKRHMNVNKTYECKL